LEMYTYISILKWVDKILEKVSWCYVFYLTWDDLIEKSTKWCSKMKRMNKF
jgi:hypothetical protein